MKIKVRKKNTVPPKKNKLDGRGRPRKKDIAGQLMLQERRREALRLRQEGKSYYRIGDELGVTQSIAFQDVNRQLKVIDESLSEETEKLRRLELTRLDRLLEGLYLPLKSKDYYERMAAMDKAIKIMDRRAKYIPGMDAPSQFQGGVDDGLKSVVESAGQEGLLMLKRLAGEPQEGQDPAT